MGNRLLSSMLLAALISSCSAGSSSDTGNTVDVIGTKKTSRSRASCDYAFSEGGKAPLELPEQNVKASRFLKRYDANLIESVQGASGSETARFAALTGVTFYQVADLDIDDKDCLFTQTLPEAPSSVLSYFRDAEDSVKGEDGGKSTLLGFYLDKKRVEEISGSDAIGPVITVKNDSERYTMIHEFFHHVFDLNREVSGSDLQDNLAKSSQVVSDVAKQYSGAKSIESLTAYTKAFDQQSKDMVKVLKEYTLEEMSIEFELNDLYQRKLLKYVNYYSRLNGDFYTVSSAESALSRIQSYEKMLDSIDSVAFEYKKENADITAVVAITSETRTLFSNLKRDINMVVRPAQARVDLYKNSLKNVSFNQDFLSQQAPKYKTGECEHDHGADKMLDGVQSKLDKIKIRK